MSASKALDLALCGRSSAGRARASQAGSSANLDEQRLSNPLWNPVPEHLASHGYVDFSSVPSVIVRDLFGGGARLKQDQERIRANPVKAREIQARKILYALTTPRLIEVPA